MYANNQLPFNIPQLLTFTLLKQHENEPYSYRSRALSVNLLPSKNLSSKSYEKIIKMNGPSPMTIGISGMPITDNISLAITGILQK